MSRNPAAGRFRRLALLAGAGTALALVGVVPGQAAAANGTIVASGLDNPRGLAVGSHGELYVGEAGHAGPFCVGAGEVGPECVGLTSQIGIVNVRNGHHRTLLGGLPSVGSAVASTGVDGVAATRHTVLGIMTGSPQGIPEEPCQHLSDTSTALIGKCPAVLGVTTRLLGDLIEVSKHRASTVADVGTYDYDWIVKNKAALGETANPDFQPGDANPYGLATSAAGTYVVDSGSNTLDLVDRFGNVHIVRGDGGEPVYFPNPPGAPDQRFPYDDVPTCVVLSGSNIYVGSLSGNLWRFDGHTVTSVADRADGLTAINGCALDRHGNILASNIFGVGPALFTPNSGSIVRITPSGTVTTLATAVNFPAGIAVTGEHTAYVAVNSVCPKSLSLVTAQDPPWCKATGAIMRLAI